MRAIETAANGNGQAAQSAQRGRQPSAGTAIEFTSTALGRWGGSKTWRRAAAEDIRQLGPSRLWSESASRKNASTWRAMSKRMAGRSRCTWPAYRNGWRCGD